MRRTRTIAVALAAGLLAAAAGIPGDADARIIVCKRKNSVKLRVGTCKGKEEVAQLNGSAVDVAELAKVPAAVAADGAATAASAAAAASAETLDGLDAAAFGRVVRWALVAEDGASIIAQSGGITIVPEAATGIYVLDFGANLLGQGLVATLHGGASARGGISASICGGPAGGAETSFCNLAGVANTVNEVAIATVDETGTSVNRSFYIAVLP
jgi:hypothetical protein